MDARVPSAHSGEVWMRILPAPETAGEQHHVHIRWGLWTREWTGLVPATGAAFSFAKGTRAGHLRSSSMSARRPVWASGLGVPATARSISMRTGSITFSPATIERLTYPAVERRRRAPGSKEGRSLENRDTLIDMSALDPRATPLYDYLYGWQCWAYDPSLGQWSRRVFGPDHTTVGTAFKQDPAFPRSWLCQIADSPYMEVVGEVVDLVLADPLPGEFDVLHGALEFACAVEEDNSGMVVMGAVGVLIGAVGLVEWSRRRRAEAEAAA